jgi:hypothetical protein
LADDADVSLLLITILVCSVQVRSSGAERMMPCPLSTRRIVVGRGEDFDSEAVMEDENLPEFR